MITHLAFENRRKEKIHGVLKRKKTGGPLIIVCHGYKSSKEHPANRAITDLLYSLGHTTFAFDFSDSAQGFAIDNQVNDILTVINFFKEEKDIILLAGSFGAFSAAIAVPQSSKIKGLITINGFFGTFQVGFGVLKIYLMMKILSFANSTYREILRYVQKNYQPQKIVVDTLVIHAKNDKTVFSSQSQTFFKQLTGRKNIYMLQKADHDLTQKATIQEIVTIIDEWLSKR